MSLVLHQFRAEQRLFWRSRELAFFTFLLPIVFYMFKKRMDIEESLLLQEFGEEYRDYMKRSARLMPGR